MANNLTTTQNTEFIPEVIANETLGALSNYLNLGRTVAKDNDLTTAKVGQVISVPKRGSVSANQKTQNGSVTKQNPTATNVTVTLDQHWEVTLSEEDFTKIMQQNGSVLPGYVEDGVIALAEKIETKLAQLHPSVVHTIAGANPVTLANMSAIRTRFSLNKVPQLARKYAYLHPTVIEDLLAVSAFNDPKTIPTSDPLVSGAIGRLYNMDVFEGQLVQTSGSPVAYHNLCYTRNGMVLATRPLPTIDASLGVQSASVVDENGLAMRVIRSYNATDLATQVTIDVVFGVAILDDRQVVELESF